MVKLSPNMYDVGAYQAWLEDEAARGRFLTKSRARYCVFTEGEPAEVRYRMEPKGQKESCPDRDRQQDYRAMGWEYVCSNGDFHIWRCGGSGAPELYTDPQTQAAAYRRMVHQTWLWLGLLGLLWMALASAIVGRFRAGGGWLFRMLTGRYFWGDWGRVIFWFLLTVEVCVYTVSLTRYVRRLRAGLPQPQRRPYRLLRAIARVTAALWVLAYLVPLAALLILPNSRPFLPEASFSEEIPYVSLPVLHPGAPSQGAEALHDWNPLLPDQWWVIEAQENGEAGGVCRCETRWFRTRPAALAKPLAESILAEKWGAAMEPLSCPGLDGAYWGAYPSGRQKLVLWRGDQVMEVGYDGPGVLRDHLADYAALLEKFQS